MTPSQDNVIPFKKKKRIIDVHTPYPEHKSQAIQDASFKLLDFLEEYDPEIAFVSALIVSITLVKQNPEADFDISTAISIIENIGRTDD
jgi:cobalamin biosynthesis Co2+ chelatase CbiK